MWMNNKLIKKYIRTYVKNKIIKDNKTLDNIDTTNEILDINVLSQTFPETQKKYSDLKKNKSEREISLKKNNETSNSNSNSNNNSKDSSSNNNIDNQNTENNIDTTDIVDNNIINTDLSNSFKTLLWKYKKELEEQKKYNENTIRIVNNEEIDVETSTERLSEDRINSDIENSIERLRNLENSNTLVDDSNNTLINLNDTIETTNNTVISISTISSFGIVFVTVSSLGLGYLILTYYKNKKNTNSNDYYSNSGNNTNQETFSYYFKKMWFLFKKKIKKLLD